MTGTSCFLCRPLDSLSCSFLLGLVTRWSSPVPREAPLAFTRPCEEAIAGPESSVSAGPSRGSMSCTSDDWCTTWEESVFRSSSPVSQPSNQSQGTVIVSKIQGQKGKPGESCSPLNYRSTWGGSTPAGKDTSSDFWGVHWSIGKRQRIRVLDGKGVENVCTIGRDFYEDTVWRRLFEFYFDFRWDRFLSSRLFGRIVYFRRTFIRWMPEIWFRSITAPFRMFEGTLITVTD